MEMLWRRRAGEPALSGLYALGVGLVLGLVPEAIASALHGGPFQQYSAGAVRSHLGAGLAALGSGDAVAVSSALFARHVTWSTFATAGAPLVLGILLVLRREGGRWRLGAGGVPRPLAAFASFAVLVWMGLLGMTVLHLLRFRFAHPEAPTVDLFTRVLDNAEPLLAVAAMASAGLLLKSTSLADSAADRLASIAPWLAGALALALLGGPVVEVAGGRVVDATGWSRLVGPDVPLPSFAAVAVLGLAAAAILWVGRQTHLAWGLALLLVLGWSLSMPTAKTRLDRGQRQELTQPLRADKLKKARRAPLAVVLPAAGDPDRIFYEPAFRSQRRVDWVRPGDELEAWVLKNPKGFVLVREGEPPPRPKPIEEAGGWLIYSSEDL
jgi:hypothetical protein